VAADAIAEDARFVVPVFHTPSAGAGAVTAYVLRRIAYRAGAYVPGVHEHLFHELNTSREGGSIDKVQRWFAARVSSLHQLGYRLQARRVTLPTAAVVDWVRAGKGQRGAMLPTAFKRLHPQPGAAGAESTDDGVQHAVGILTDHVDGTAGEELVMIDPWPGIFGDKDRARVPAKLDAAHRDRGLHALVVYWVGWS
jgi:hypothetical protein